MRGRGRRLGDGERYRVEHSRVDKEVTSSFNRETSVRKSSTSLEDGDRGHGRGCCIEDPVGQSSDLVEALRVARGGEYHTHIGREAL